ncbi:adenosylmethionine-8-amino-7-oxononanoate aminotransferase [Saccharothrix tamanrassetensis]|uniref:Adenosylmethionine-8-amino-7-oxononanoate aminotransferase n=1 Tax=Saccharothrix tamanrassetensis TaxID=1051531 RepID=A0A841CC63_9PSEU|nr:adenosylmethionine--8-amino-7-oxononanoate transaminase [Saccharothrix tamanrassetensis]MBB5953767.1 adenosylmethionine-8-amino-7-oxononanoate aminotransferase [Saccharothrix tamanrassetensis]
MTDTERLQTLDQQHVWHPYTPTDDYLKTKPLVIDHGEGVYLVDSEGNRYLDGGSSLGVNIHGHQRPELNEALAAQAAKVAHTTLYGMTHPGAAELAERLVRLAPEGIDKVLFLETGSSAVETAMKMAYSYWVFKGAPQRNKFVSMTGAFHGDTMGALSVGQMTILKNFYQPLLRETSAFAQPYCYRCTLCQDNCTLACADTLEEVLEREGDQVAAVLIEPRVQNVSGMIVARDGHLGRVAEIAKKHGVLLIADELGVGFGRTGKMFACEADGVTPDILCVGKGLTGGYMPLAATMATAEVFDAFRGDGKMLLSGHTYSGNPLSVAVALASLELFEKDDVVRRAQEMSVILAEELAKFRPVPHVGDIRQCGMLAAVELVEDQETREPFPWDVGVAGRITDRCKELGLIIHSAPNDTIVIVPPLAMTDEELRTMMGILLQATRDVVGSLAS